MAKHKGATGDWEWDPDHDHPHEMAKHTHATPKAQVGTSDGDAIAEAIETAAGDDGYKGELLGDPQGKTGIPLPRIRVVLGFPNEAGWGQPEVSRVLEWRIDELVKYGTDAAYGGLMCGCALKTT